MCVLKLLISTTNWNSLHILIKLWPMKISMIGAIERRKTIKFVKAKTKGSVCLKWYSMAIGCIEKNKQQLDICNKMEINMNKQFLPAKQTSKRNKKNLLEDHKEFYKFTFRNFVH